VRAGFKKMSWRDLIFTILGGFIAGVSGILVARYSEKRRREAEHLRDIKQRCLGPLLKELQGLKERLIISEARPLHKICEQLEFETSWWGSYSFGKITDVDPLLYDDLKNHYQDLYQDLEGIEAWMRTEYPNFLLAIYKLLEMISRDPEFKEFKAELERMNVGVGDPFIREDFPQNIVLFLILDVDKDLWPNIYPYIKPVMNKAIHLKEKFYMATEAQNAREIMHNIMITIDNCITKTREVIYRTKLRGKCKYL
jgi:hypothetical protein